MPSRFFCADIDGPTAELDESESHHAMHVLRLVVGDTVELFDGSGSSVIATVAGTSRRTVSVDIESRKPAIQSRRPRLTVAASPPRGDRLKSMVEKLTELGVDSFIPLRAVRSVVDPGQSKLEKLRSTVIGAMKQSGRNHLMEIGEPSELSVALRQASLKKQAVYIAHPGDVDLKLEDQVRRDSLLLIGPEGGFTAEEVLQATDYGASRVAWPEGILRIETAAATFATLLLAHMSQSA